MQLHFSNKQIIWSSLLCFSAMAFPLTSQAITVQEVPNPRQVNNTWVTDNANILSDRTETQLNQMISDLEAKNGSEIAVVTVPDRENPDFANRLPAGKIKRIEQGKKMSITPEEQLRLSACIDEIAQILYKNTDSAEISTLEGLEKVVRQQMLEYVSPKVALFLSKK